VKDQILSIILALYVENGKKTEGGIEGGLVGSSENGHPKLVGGGSLPDCLQAR
jgi:hypothetical protein